MKKTIITLSIMAAIAGTVFLNVDVTVTKKALAQESDISDHIELLADTSRNFSRDGLYKVHDTESNNIIYILTTYRNNSDPQMVVVSGD